MATSIPQTFTGTPILTAEKVATLKDWYICALGDSDKAYDILDRALYQGLAYGYGDALTLLHETVQETVKAKPKHTVIKISVVVGLSYLSYRLYRADQEKRQEYLSKESNGKAS